MKKKIILCSACLLGVKSRYDGKSKLNKKLLKLAKQELLIPVCPEQLGGLPTPRARAEKRKGKVVTKLGKDITFNFKKGAREVLQLAKLFEVKKAILKQGSPSCGCGKIYDGTFSGKLIKGDGLTTALLKRHNIKVTTEEDL